MKYKYSRILNKFVYEITYKTTDSYGTDIDLPGVMILQLCEYDDVRNITKNSFLHKQTGRQETKFRKLKSNEFQYIMIDDLIPVNLNQFLIDKKLHASDNTESNLIIMCDYTNGLLTDNK